MTVAALLLSFYRKTGSGEIMLRSAVIMRLGKRRRTLASESVTGGVLPLAAGRAKADVSLLAGRRQAILPATEVLPCDVV
jgi:hypothetical protein